MGLSVRFTDLVSLRMTLGSTTKTLILLSDVSHFDLHIQKLLQINVLKLYKTLTYVTPSFDLLG